MANHEDRSVVRSLVNDAMAIASSDPGAAIERLELALSKARENHDPGGVQVAATSAGLISMHQGDPGRGLAYFDIGLAETPSDPYLHYARGDALVALGDLAAARVAFDRSAVFARDQGDPELATMALSARDAAAARS